MAKKSKRSISHSKNRFKKSVLRLSPLGLAIVLFACLNTLFLNLVVKVS